MNKFFSRGFTFVEVLVVGVIITLLIAVVTPEFSRIRDNQYLKSAVSDVVTAFDQAKSHTLSGYNNTNWGIYFDTGNNKVVLFEGQNYLENDPDNIEVPISGKSQITNVSLSGGGNGIYFNRLTGEPSKTGTITVESGDVSKIITINALGAVSTSAPTQIVNLGVSLSGQGTVTSSPSGISCGADCSESYALGTNVTLSANPSTCYSFSSFSGDCSGGVCALTMDSAKSVTANFSPSCATYTLTIPSAPTGGTITSSPSGISCGTGGADCDEVYTDVTVVSLTPVPDPGYTFTSWGGYCSGSGTCNVPMTTNRSVSATFTFVGYYPIVTGSNQSTVAVDTSGNHTVLLPSNIQANELLLIFFSVDGLPSSVTLNGWNKLAELDSPSPYETLVIFYKTAVGGGGDGASVNVNIGAGAEMSAHQSFRIANYSGVPEASIVSGLSINPNSLSLNPSAWGAESALWFTVVGRESSDVANVSYPSGYGNGITTLSNSTFQGSALSSARKTADTASEDPGAYTIAQSDAWVAATLAIKGTGTGGAPSTETLTVSKSGTGSGAVSSSPVGIDCGSTCSYAFNSGTSVTLSATSSVGSTFTGWSGEGCSGTGTCVVSMTQARSVTATFTLNTYALAITKNGMGTVTATNPVPPPGINCGATCNYSYNYGTSVTLSATPSAGYSFTGWSGEGCSGTGTCVVSMTQARSVTATFTLQTFNLYVSQNGTGSGTVTSSPAGINCGVTCGYDFNYNTSVTLSASASGGSNFVGWSGEGCSGTGTCVVSMTQARTVTATFNLDTPSNYALTISKSGTGSGTVSSSPTGIDCGITCDYSYSSGTSVTLSSTPTTGSTFTGWSGEGCSGTGTCVVSMTQARSVTATFTLNTYALAVSKTGDGSGTVTSSPAGINCGATCNYNFDYNTSVTLSASASGGSTFTGWSGEGCSGTGTCVVSMTQARSVTATFTADSGFPQIASSSSGNVSTNEYNHTINMPSGVASGDLLMLFISFDGLPGLTLPSGWNNIMENSVTNGATYVTSFVYYKIADGTEGASMVVQITGGGNPEQSAHQILRITGHSNSVATPPQISFTSSTGSINPDSPSLSPTWGLRKTLWITSVGKQNGSDVLVNSYPTNYTSGIASYGGTGGFGAGQAIASRQLEAVSEDPGTFALSDIESWTASTIAVRGSGGPVSQITHVGSNSGAGTTISIPAHQAGDLIVMFAYRDGSTTAPSLPTGWTNIGTAGGANTNSSRLAYRVATGSGTLSGTWTSATNLVVSVYRGVHATTPIGANGDTGAASTTVTYPGMTLTQNNGTSWVVGFSGHRSVNTNLQTAPSGMTNRTTFVDATAEVAGHSSTEGVSSWSNTNVAVGGTSSGWRARTLEIISQ